MHRVPSAPPSTAPSSPDRPKSHEGGRSSASGRPPTSPGGLAKIQSKQERINEILEIGLARAQSSKSEPAQHQTTARMEPLLGRASKPGSTGHQRRGSGDDGSSSEDEHHGTLPTGGGSARGSTRRRGIPNYQSTATSDHRHGNGGNLSSRRSTVNSNTGRNGASSPRPSADGNGNGCNGGQEGRGGGLLASIKNTLASFGSVELENKGSVARDHLALERTFLAWLRTSVSFASIGIAVTQLFRLNTSLNSGTGGRPPSQAQEELRRLGKPLGATFLGISILILFLGYNRYTRGQKWVMAGRFPASRGTVIVVTLLTFAVMVASLAIVVIFAPGVREA